MSEANDQSHATQKMSFGYHLAWWLVDTAVGCVLVAAFWLYAKAKPSYSENIGWYFVAFAGLYMLYGGLSNVAKVRLFRRRCRQRN